MIVKEAKQGLNASFDPVWHLNLLLQQIGLSTADAGGAVSFTGEDPIFASRHRLGACIGLPIMGCAVATAAIWKMRTGLGQDLHLDLRQAIHGINPEFAWHPTLNGEDFSHATVRDNPFLLEPYRTRDGRWVMASGVYPHMVADWLRFLNCTNSESAVRQAISRLTAQNLEDAAAMVNLPLTICRTPEEWAEHPQGALLATTPVITIRKISDGPPMPFGPAQRPLSGVRVLAFVHAVAGSVVGRTLAEQGAEVLCATFPNHFEHDFIYNDVNVGSRSCNLNLNDGTAQDMLTKLLKDTDIVVDNHRGEKLWQFGLSPEQLAVIKPGMISVSVRAYGLEGPWADRGGFDMNGSAASGLMAIEGSADDPKLPPTGMINDYVTGYMGALGATAALIRRAKEGGSYHVSVNLTRNAMWCSSLGLVDPAKAGCGVARQAVNPRTVSGETSLGILNRLAPPVTFSHTPGYWESAMLVVRGSSQPQWKVATRSSWISRLGWSRNVQAGRDIVAESEAKSCSASSLREALAAANAFAKKIDAKALPGMASRYQFKLNQVGSFVLVIENGQCIIVEGIIPNPSVTLTMAAATFFGLVKGDVSGVKAYFTGKLKIEGDKMLCKRILELVGS